MLTGRLFSFDMHMACLYQHPWFHLSSFPLRTTMDTMDRYYDPISTRRFPPQRPALLYVDLSSVPAILEDLHGTQVAHQISQSNLPDLTACYSNLLKVLQI